MPHKYAVRLTDVPGEKIWRELKLILCSQWGGHVMRMMLEQQLGPLLGRFNSICHVCFE
jgi:hypothetical protein